MKKKRRPLETRRLIIVVLTLTLFVSLGLVWLFVSLNTRTDLGNSYVTYNRGHLSTYNNTTSIEKTNDGVLLVDKAYIETPLVSEDGVLVTKDMIYNALSNRRVNCVPASSFITMDGDYVTISDMFDEENKFSAENGFLYDGNKIYLLLQDTTLEVNDRKINLSPMSYVVYDKDGITYFDFESQKGDFEEFIKKETSISCPGYEINLDSAIVTFKDVTVLLFSDTKVIKSIFE